MAGRKKKRLGDPRDEYVQSDVKITLRQLAKLYQGQEGCSKRQLEQRCAQEKWVEQREEFWKKAQEKADEKAIEQAARRKVKTLDELNEEHSKRIQALIKYNENLLRQATKKVKNKETGKDELILDMSPNDLRRITANIIDAQAAERLYNNILPKAPPEEPDTLDDEEETGEDPILAMLGQIAETEWADHEADPVQ